MCIESDTLRDGRKIYITVKKASKVKGVELSECRCTRCTAVPGWHTRVFRFFDFRFRDIESFRRGLHSSREELGEGDDLPGSTLPTNEWQVVLRVVKEIGYPTFDFCAVHFERYHPFKTLQVLSPQPASLVPIKVEGAAYKRPHKILKLYISSDTWLLFPGPENGDDKMEKINKSCE
ncbi:hypothetical protein KQX54_017445 [Cotesia glomerata]|uniref:Uncharacterized protein n=1 Tax=Cotesia glomerata TaxID=32391 RepID=A0AAV7HYP7_COTGL|nr:hypothetical protein KQX54_017445 [Cotesia glomerata]